MRRALAILLVTLAAACGSDSTAPNTNNVNVSGVWNLRTMNGQALPITATVNGIAIVITSDVLTLNGSNSGTYTDIGQYRVATSGQIGTNVEAGTWSATGGSITLNDQTDGVTYQASVTGSALTEIVSGVTQVYGR
jgi:hypothetical protein